MPHSGILGKSASSLDKLVLGEANDAAAVVEATPGLIILFKNDEGILTPLKEEFGHDGTLYRDGAIYEPDLATLPSYDLSGLGLGIVQYGLVDGISDSALQTTPSTGDSFKYILPSTRYLIADAPLNSTGEDGDFLFVSTQPNIIWYEYYKYQGRWYNNGNLNFYPVNPHPYIPDPTDHTNYNIPTTVGIVLSGSGAPTTALTQDGPAPIVEFGGVVAYHYHIYINTDTAERWQQRTITDGWEWYKIEYSTQLPQRDTTSQVTIKTTTPVALNGEGTMELWFRPFEFGSERYVDPNDSSIVVERTYFDIMRLRQGDQSIALRTSIANPNHINQFVINYNYVNNDGTYSAGDDVSQFFFHGLESDSTSYQIPTIQIGDWYHLVLAWDQTKVSAYVNGTLAWDSLSDSPSYPVPVVGVTTDFGGQIGEINGWTLDWGTSGGQYDLVAVFDRKLTDGEINRHYSAAAPGRVAAPLRVSSLYSPFAATHIRNARLGRMDVETLYSTVRNARISKQYIETLRSVDFDTAIHRNVQHTLTYTSTGFGEVRHPILIDITQTLALNHYGTGIENPLDPDMHQTLTFTQTAVGNRSTLLTQTLAFTQTVTHTAVFNRSPIHLLNFQATIGLQKTLNLTATDTLDFIENGGRGDTHNILTFVETLIGYVSHDVTDMLAFTQTVSLEKNQRDRELLDPLIFSELAWINGPNAYTVPTDILSDAGPGDIELGITDDYGYNTELLSFSQTIALDKIRKQSPSQTLAFTQNATIVKVYHRTVVQTLNFLDGNISRNLDMLINGTPVIYSVPVASYSVVRHGHKIVTYQSKKGIITMPAPEWGDTEGLGNTVTIKRSMNGKVYSYIKTAKWMKVNYDFTITRKKAFELRTFLQANLTEVITMRNWKGQVFVGQFTVNPTSMVATGRYKGSYEKVTVSLEFEGVRVHG